MELLLLLTSNLVLIKKLTTNLLLIKKLTTKLLLINKLSRETQSGQGAPSGGVAEHEASPLSL